MQFDFGIGSEADAVNNGMTEQKEQRRACIEYQPQIQTPEI